MTSQAVLVECTTCVDTEWSHSPKSGHAALQILYDRSVSTHGAARPGQFPTWCPLPIPGSALPTQFLGEYQEKHGSRGDCRDSAGILGLIAASKSLIGLKGRVGACRTQAGASSDKSVD